MLLDSTCKLLDKLITARLREEVKTKLIIHEGQAGLMEKRAYVAQA